MGAETQKGMKCTECGAAMSTRTENHRYEECGLRYVTLRGISVNRCPDCGNFEVSIPRLEELHRLIAKCLIEKMTRFTGAEIRFLRKILGLSAADFARRVGVTVETVSRWENNATVIGTQADRLLRLLIALGKLPAKYPAEKLDLIDSGKASDTRLGLRLQGQAWSAEACA